MSKKKKRVTRHEEKVTLWGMIQTVLLAAINKGQVLEVMIGLIFLVSVARMPPNALLTFWTKVLDGLENLSLVGWTGGIIVGVGWFVHAKWQRRNLHGEIERVSDERSDLQEKLIGKDSITTSK